MTDNSELHIPYILENTSILPFTFNGSMHKFIIGTSKEIVDSKNLFNALIYQTDVLGLDMMRTLSAGIIHSDSIITGPAFYEFLETPQAKSTFVETEEIMYEVYNEVHSKKADRTTIGGAYGFDAYKLREGQAMLSVLGNCACLGPNLYGFIRENQWKSKFVEYEVHNIDYPAQLVSLFAGIGYIAAKATE